MCNNKVPPVIDDVLPSNEHGNVEIWDGLQKYVPRGAAYIRNNRAKTVATNLGIAFVPALIGFDRSGSHTVPKLDGVIVLQRHEQLMLDATFYVDAVKDELQYMKSEKKIVDKWYRLVVSMLNRQALRATYGH
jgi:xeroderma pigmentosum group C-complementing protein